MSNGSGWRRNQNQPQNKCYRCKRQIPKELVMCERCQDLGYCIGQPVTEDQESSDYPTKELTVPEVNKTAGGARFNANPKKKKKKKNKKGQGPNLSDSQSLNRPKSGTGENCGKDVKNLGATMKEDVKVKSGESFGEGWWNPKDKKDQAEGISKPQAAGSEMTAGKARLMYKDFYGDSEEEEEDDMDGNNEEILKQAKLSASAPAAEVEKALSGLKIEKTGSKATGEKKDIQSDKSSSKKGRCSYCHKEGFILNCSRCQLSSYCNRQCQKSHYPEHKAICRRKEIFNKAESQIPEILKLAFKIKWGSFSISTSLEDLPSEFEYHLGNRALVMAEITGPSYHIFRYSIEIRDLLGRQTHIIFYIDSDVYLHKTAEGATRAYPLSICLQPGNFVLLLDTHFHHFVDGTVGIRINSLSEIHFILTN